MNERIRDTVLNRLSRAEGDISFYYENLSTGERMEYNAAQPLVAASVIKLPIMVEAFRQMDCGMVYADETFIVLSEDRQPGCGVLSHLHDGVSAELIDLVTLMIIVSDNTATNMLIRRLGMDAINRTMRDLGLMDSSLNRKLFDAEQAQNNVQNYVSAADMGALLKHLYSHEIVSTEASAQMLKILKNQKLNGKMPFHMDGFEIAHKTGEDDGITHDVGIVYADEPFIACYLSNNTDTPAFERAIQELTALLAGKAMEK